MFSPGEFPAWGTLPKSSATAQSTTASEVNTSRSRNGRVISRPGPSAPVGFMAKGIQSPSSSDNNQTGGMPSYANVTKRDPKIYSTTSLDLEHKGQQIQHRSNNIFRLNKGIRDKIWAPKAPSQQSSNNVKIFESYHKQLKEDLAKIKDPIEKCLRVSACIDHLHHQFNCNIDNSTFILLRKKFDQIYKTHLAPCIEAIGEQISEIDAKEYFQAMNEAIRFFKVYPGHRTSLSDGIRSDIESLVHRMIESELGYFEFLHKKRYPETGNNTWALNRFKWFLGKDSPVSKYNFINDTTRTVYLNELQKLEQTLNNPVENTQQCEKQYKQSRVDTHILSGQLIKAINFILNHGSDYRHEERLICQLLKSRFDQILEPSHLKNRTTQQDLSLLEALYLFRKTYDRFIKRHYFLTQETINILSAVVARVIDIHLPKINDPAVKKTPVRIINELIRNTELTDHCQSLWRDFLQGYRSTESHCLSLQNMTSHDAFEAFKDITSLCDEGTEISMSKAAEQLKIWAINANAILLMKSGEMLAGRLSVLKHRLYKHFFHGIFQSSAIGQQIQRKDYSRVLNTMAGHRASCLKNQTLLFILKDDKHREKWEQTACQAWGSLILDVTIRLQNQAPVCPEDFQSLLELKTISPELRCIYTRGDFKKLTTLLFKALGHHPSSRVEISPEQFGALTDWALHLAEDRSTDNSSETELNKKLKTAINTFQHQKTEQRFLTRPSPALPLTPVNGQPRSPAPRVPDQTASTTEFSQTCAPARAPCTEATINQTVLDTREGKIKKAQIPILPTVTEVLSGNSPIGFIQDSVIRTETAPNPKSGGNQEPDITSCQASFSSPAIQASGNSAKPEFEVKDDQYYENLIDNLTKVAEKNILKELMQEDSDIPAETAINRENQRYASSPYPQTDLFPIPSHLLGNQAVTHYPVVTNTVPVNRCLPLVQQNTPLSLPQQFPLENQQPAIYPPTPAQPVYCTPAQQEQSLSYPQQWPIEFQQSATWTSPCPAQPVYCTPAQQEQSLSYPQQWPVEFQQSATWTSPSPAQPVYSSAVQNEQPLLPQPDIMASYMPVYHMTSPQSEYQNLMDNFNNISSTLIRINKRLQSDIRYLLMTKEDLTRISQYLTRLMPFFKPFCPDESVYSEFQQTLSQLTSNTETGQIDDAFHKLIQCQMGCGNISGAADLICVRNGLYMVRRYLGLTINYTHHIV